MPFTAEMRGLRPQSYIVTLDRASNDRFLKKGLVPIYTDGAHFVSMVKQRLISEKQMVEDERYDRVASLLRYVRTRTQRTI